MTIKQPVPNVSPSPGAVIQASPTVKDSPAVERALNRSKIYLLISWSMLYPEDEEFLDYLRCGEFVEDGRAALETLAIIAYQQPVTRPSVDSVRGVNSDGVIKSLLSKGLLQEVGRSEGPGRPILYGTTPEFLQHFGLNSLTELPPLDLAEANDKDVELLKG